MPNTTILSHLAHLSGLIQQRMLLPNCSSLLCELYMFFRQRENKQFFSNNGHAFTLKPNNHHMQEKWQNPSVFSPNCRAGLFVSFILQTVVWLGNTMCQFGLNMLLNQTDISANIKWINSKTRLGFLH